MIRLPTFSPAAPTKTPPPSFVPPAVKHSPHGPRSPAWRWLRNHACRRPSLNPSRLSLFHRRQVDDAVMDRAAWWQVLRDIPPLATRAKDIHQAVDDFAHVHRTLIPARSGRRYQRRDLGPFLIRQVVGVPSVPTMMRHLPPGSLDPQARKDPLAHAHAPHSERCRGGRRHDRRPTASIRGGARLGIVLSG